MFIKLDENKRTAKSLLHDLETLISFHQCNLLARNFHQNKGELSSSLRLSQAGSSHVKQVQLDSLPLISRITSRMLKVLFETGDIFPISIQLGSHLHKENTGDKVGVRQGSILHAFSDTRQTTETCTQNISFQGLASANSKIKETLV